MEFTHGEGLLWFNPALQFAIGGQFWKGMWHHVTDDRRKEGMGFIYGLANEYGTQESSIGNIAGDNGPGRV